MVADKIVEVSFVSILALQPFTLLSTSLVACRYLAWLILIAFPKIVDECFKIHKTFKLFIKYFTSFLGVAK